MIKSDASLRLLVDAIAARDSEGFSKLLAKAPALAKARFGVTNATRQSANQNFIAPAGRYIYRGDTALHFAAASYAVDMISTLIAHGADVRARNRLGDEPLHVAAAGDPGSESWNPEAQSAAIQALISAGAEPNVANKLGVSPLHKAVRTRCAHAVRTLLASGADPAKKNKRGSDAILLARLNTGRGGSGLPEAKAQQIEILRLLKNALASG
ncbi:MAG TPA: ankyrin repeat domain-containing protein [Terracidiphilus sp.]|nr:ankyrin repeat domain-containing protein [Terracidiphilus sp.]